MTTKQNHFNLTATALFKALFPALVFECIITPSKSKTTKKNGKPVTGFARVKPAKNGQGWTGVGSGSTVEALMESVAILAATLKQRAVNGAEKGRIPAALLTEMQEAWAQFDTPELRESATRMILDAAKPSGKQSKVRVDLTRDGETVTGHYTNRDAKLIQKMLSMVRSEVTVSVQQADGSMKTVSSDVKSKAA